MGFAPLLDLHEAWNQPQVAARANRYLINAPMLPDLVKDPEGGLTIYIQTESPGAEKESNWLPAPADPFFAAMRLYWPKEEALTGAWTAPPVQIVE